jgi:hypothetical protein
MAHAFKTIPAKSTFGTLQEELNQSDYINRKKRKCNTILYTNKSNTILYTNKSNLIIGRKQLNKSNLIVGKQLNKSNLIVGQYTKLDLYNVCNVSKGPPPAIPCEFNNDCNPCQDSVTINASSTNPFYFNYTIDPLGELFGKTSCGILNYTNYMVFNPPKTKL